MASERLNPVDSSRTRARRASSSSRTDIASAMFKAQYHIVSYSRFGLGATRRETTRPDAPASPPGKIGCSERQHLHIGGRLSRVSFGRPRSWPRGSLEHPRDTRRHRPLEQQRHGRWAPQKDFRSDNGLPVTRPCGGGSEVSTRRSSRLFGNDDIATSMHAGVGRAPLQVRLGRAAREDWTFSSAAGVVAGSAVRTLQDDSVPQQRTAGP